MSVFNKILPGIIFNDGKGGVIRAGVGASAVIMPDGTALPDKLAADAVAQTAALTTAINLLKDGADRDNLKKLADALSSTYKLVDDFINGGATDNGVFDRLVELVTQIDANKDNIAGLLSDKVNVSDVVNDLTTGGAAKVLSAEQGKSLKALIDALQVSVDQQLAAIHTHANKAVLDTVTANHTLLATKLVTEVPATWPADVRVDGVLYLVEATA